MTEAEELQALRDENAFLRQMLDWRDELSKERDRLQECRPRPLFNWPWTYPGAGKR